MGQKANPNLLRLGINNTEWKTLYACKTHEEYSLFALKNLEIKNYLCHFLSKKGLIFHDYKIYVNNQNIYISISYFISLKSILVINNNHKSLNIKLKKKLNNILRIKKKSRKNNFLDKKYQKRNLLLKKYKHYLNCVKYCNFVQMLKNNFTENILETLNQFTNNKYNIYLTFQNLNSNISFNVNKNFWRKKLLILKKYRKRNFFKETVNIMSIVIMSKNSALILAEFLSKQLKSTNRHFYFLMFLKKVFSLFILAPESKIAGIKVKINGRFNGRPRANCFLLTAGKIPTQTLKANINYNDSVTFSSNGTFGIKVWIAEK